MVNNSQHWSKTWLRSTVTAYTEWEPKEILLSELMFSEILVSWEVFIPLAFVHFTWHPLLLVQVLGWDSKKNLRSFSPHTAWDSPAKDSGTETAQIKKTLLALWQRNWLLLHFIFIFFVFCKTVVNCGNLNASIHFENTSWCHSRLSWKSGLRLQISLFKANIFLHLDAKNTVYSMTLVSENRQFLLLINPLWLITFTRIFQINLLNSDKTVHNSSNATLLTWPFQHVRFTLKRGAEQLCSN